MRVSGKHRNLALAERRLSALAREHGGTWSITSRRTADGRFSDRGRHFTFEQTPEDEEPEEPEDQEQDEFVVSSSYKGSKSNNVSIQFSIFAPRKATREKVIEAINAHIDHSDLPKGFKVKAMWWNGKKSRNIRRDTDAFSAPLSFADIRVPQRRHRKG